MSAGPLINVCGRDVLGIQAVDGNPERSVNDKLCHLSFFIGALENVASNAPRRSPGSTAAPRSSTCWKVRREIPQGHGWDV